MGRRRQRRKARQQPRPDWTAAVRALLEAGASTEGITVSPDDPKPPSPEIATCFAATGCQPTPTWRAGNATLHETPWAVGDGVPGKTLPAADLEGHAPAALVQAYLGRQRHEAFSFGSVVPNRSDGEDEPALPEAHLLDQDRVTGIGQHDDVASIDVTSQDLIIHNVYSTARKASFQLSRERDMCGS